MNGRHFAVCGIVEIGGKILLVRHTYGTAKGRILVPGGYVREGECLTGLLSVRYTRKRALFAKHVLLRHWKCVPSGGALCL